ncbi:MAG: hypothetical protein IJN48_03815 [Clostridia bacterium]|nr:hypothetical protein [Clostridia bacterium]
MTGKSEFFSVSKRHIVKQLSPKLIYTKLLFLYAFIYTLSFFLGCLLFHALKLESERYISDRINEYFSVSFDECETIYDYTDLLLNISNIDISHLLIIFTAGFTMLAGVIVSILFLFRGFSFGFSISYFAFAVNNGILSISYPYASLVIYSVICAVEAVILIHFGVKTTWFSDDFKLLGGRPRVIIKSKALYSQLFRFLIAFGAILILNLIRCVV